MAYVKTTWNAGVAPGISAANLNNLETQYDTAVADIVAGRQELWIPPAPHTGGGITLTADGKYAAMRFPNASVPDVGYFLPFIVPHDFDSLTSVKLLIAPDGSDTIDWTFYTEFCALGEVLTANADSMTADDLAVTASTRTEIDVTDAFTGIAAGDLVGNYLVFDVIDGAANIFVFGLKFKYAA